MPAKSSLAAWGALLCIGLVAPAAAQAVYRCGSRYQPTYSQQPCSGGRKVNTDDAPVPVKPNPREVDVRRLEHNRVLAQSLRRRPGETTAQFETRRRRTRMLDTDREECERLEKRIPVEQARMDNPGPEGGQAAAAALAQSRKRFSGMRC